MVAAIVIFVLLLLGIAVSVFDIGSGVYVKALCRARTVRKVVALTFDDGPHPERTPKILDLLKKHDVRAAFFVTGKNAEKHPELIKRMVSEGHLVGNHTYSHSSRFPWMKEEKMREEIHWCDVAITRITGMHPTLFRPPFGVSNPTLARAVVPWHYTVAGWSVRSLDTVSRWPRAKVFERVRRRLRPGSVVLLHDDREGGDILLEMILDHLERNGYKVERFDKLFGL